jgi:hypothetical protein
LTATIIKSILNFCYEKKSVNVIPGGKKIAGYFGSNETLKVSVGKLEYFKMLKHVLYILFDRFLNG